MDRARTKPASASLVQMTQLMRPQHANFRGNVHGGTLLALMDEAAYACASRFSEAYCVTVAADAVEMVAPVRVGDLLGLAAKVVYTGRTSMEVGITVRASNPRTPEDERLTCRCSFTMVAVDDDGRPRPVPQVVLESAEDRRANCEALLRRDLRRRYHADLAAGICQVGVGPAGFEPATDGL